MQVDLRSDTITQPTPAMRRAIYEAEVGDDVFDDDPTVKRLEAMVCERLGMSAALFVPSGTMANQIAVRLNTRPGDEILVESGAHVFYYEAGAAAMLSAVTARTVHGASGHLDPVDCAACFRPIDPHFAPLTLVCVEDTSNRGGGSVYPLETLDALANLAHARGATAHLDGARQFNAAVASGVSIDRRVRAYDTVSICLSKGLGAPVGSVLCFPADWMERARRFRKALGGGMRQSGFLAAAGIYALEHHVDRLADDHDRATALARGLTKAGYTVRPPETNMVYVDVPNAPFAAQTLDARGVRCCATGPETIRLVTHLDVDDAGIRWAVEGFSSLVSP